MTKSAPVFVSKLGDKFEIKFGQSWVKIQVYDYSTSYVMFDCIGSNKKLQFKHEFLQDLIIAAAIRPL
jgi:hypothetical protein